MAALIEEEGLDEDGRPIKYRTLHHQQKHKCKQVKKIMQEEDKDEDDDEDGDFSDSSSGDKPSSESESDVSDNMIPNHKVHFSYIYQIADMLLLKTPSTKQNKATTRTQQIKSASASLKAKSMAHAKKKLRKPMVEEVEYEGSPRNVSAHNHATSPDPAAPTEIMMSNMEQRKKLFPRMPMVSEVILVTSTIAAVMAITKF
ncbi:hypothetical protein JB92DRAFT_2835197 [Gautieria morchelliformis]|nr:hypothetical protein JB92DRAFT_2835197 [Gautieria morchelliformis]